MPESRQKQLERLRVQIDQFIQLYDRVFLGSRNDALVDAGAQKRPRRDGSAPTNDAAHRFFADPDNADAARKIEPAISELHNTWQTYNGINLYYVICVAGVGGSWGVDFAELRRWQARRSKDARDHHDAYKAALDMLARMVLAECERLKISPEINVNPRGEDGQDDTQVESKDAAAKQDAAQSKEVKRKARDERIRERYEQLKTGSDMTDSHIREKLTVEFAPTAPGRERKQLSRETVNSALRAAVA